MKERVIYKMIKEYIEAEYVFKVHAAYIVEEKFRFVDVRCPKCDTIEGLKQLRKDQTEEKEEAINDA